MSNIHSMINLGEELQHIQNAANDLWTWLPSYNECKKYHKDHTHNFTPPIGAIMLEACFYISKLKGSKEDPEWFKCPCGEDHENEDADKVKLRKDLTENINPCYLCKNAGGHHVKHLQNFEYLLCLKNMDIDTCTYIGSCPDFVRVDLDDEFKRLEWADEFSDKCNNS